MRWGSRQAPEVSGEKPKKKVVYFTVAVTSGTLTWTWTFDTGDETKDDADSKELLVLTTGNPDENGWVRYGDVAIRPDRIDHVTRNRHTKQVDDDLAIIPAK